MPWNFKNNPLLRAVLVFAIGIFAFELLFSSFTGGGDTMGGHMDMGSSSMNGSYGSFSGLISGLLILLVKILMVLLIAAVIVGVFVWVRNNFFKNSNFNIVQSIKNDPILKTISVITIAIIGIVLIFALLGSFGQNQIGFSGQMGNYGFSFGYNPIYSIAGLLLILVKVLMFILVVSLILAAITYLKNQYDKGNLSFLSNQTQSKNSTINNEQTTQPGNTNNTTE
jgi:cell division protein FtsL